MKKRFFAALVAICTIFAITMVSCETDSKDEKVTISFDLNGGTYDGADTIANKTIAKGASLGSAFPIDSKMNKADFDFDGWKSGDNLVDKDTPFNASQKIVAQWKTTGTTPPTSVTVAGDVTAFTKGAADRPFTATVLPAGASQIVTWTVETTPADATGVSISTAGYLKVTAASNASAVVVKATSTDPAVSGSSTSIAINDPDPDKEVTSVTVTVDGSATSIVKGDTLQFFAAAIPTDAIQTVTWTFTTTPNTATGVSISDDGLLSVAADSNAEAVVVKATSTKTPSKSGDSASITVTSPVVYDITLVVSGKQGTDTASATPESGIADETITINYTLADVESYNAVIFSGAVTDRIETSGTGSITYTIDPENAVAGKITINAVFVHVDKDSINGLWWNEGIITEAIFAGSGTYGVWVLEYPNFWRVNAWGFAHKGTYEIAGGSDGNAFIATSTRKKESNYTWGDASDDVITATSWTLSQDGTTLTLNTTVWTNDNPSLPVSLVFTKTDWYAAENNGANNGPWEDKINDPALNAIIPPRPITGPYGWVSGTEFKLPPFIEQPTPYGKYPRPIEQNVASATRDLLSTFILGDSAFPAPGSKSVADGNGSEGRQIVIRSTSADSQNTRLEGQVFRKSQYIVIEIGPNHTPASLTKQICSQWYGTTPIRSASGSTAWIYETFTINNGRIQGSWASEPESIKIDGNDYSGTSRWLVFNMSRTVGTDYGAWAGANLGSPKPGEDGYNINSGQLKLNLGFRANQGVIFDEWDIRNIYLVNIMDSELSPEPIGSFNLTAPASDAVDVADDPTFTWGTALNATSYLLEVSKSSTFASDIISKTVSSTSTKLDSPLEPGEAYYWRVTASATGLVSKVSAVRSFTTEAAGVVYGWVDDEFILPPMMATDDPGIKVNTVSATRDLMQPLVTGSSAPAVTPGTQRITIYSDNYDWNASYQNQLTGEVFRKAQYLVFEVGANFTGFEVTKAALITGWSSGTSGTPIQSAANDNWANGTGDLTAANACLVTAAGVINTNKNAVKYDATNKLVVLDLSKALLKYNVFAGENEVQNMGDTINTGFTRIMVGYPGAGPATFFADYDIQNVYLVNIIE